MKAEDCVEAHGQPTEPFVPNDFSKGTRTDFGVCRHLATLALSAVEHVTRESRPCPVRSGAEQRPAVLQTLEVRHNGQNDEARNELRRLTLAPPRPLRISSSVGKMILIGSRLACLGGVTGICAGI